MIKSIRLIRSAADSWLWSPRRHRRDVVRLAGSLGLALSTTTLVVLWMVATVGHVWVGLELVPAEQVAA